MGRLIKNHWARLIILTASAYQIGGAIEGFIWPKVFWDFMTDNLNGAVNPIPVLQILNLLMGLVCIAWEWPLKYLAGSPPHRSIEFRLILYPLSALLSMLLYQGTDPAIYYLIGVGVYFWAYSEGEYYNGSDNGSDYDVPVNKKTSFHGHLNQYFHTTKNIIPAQSQPTTKPTTTTTTRTTTRTITRPVTRRTPISAPSTPNPSDEKQASTSLKRKRTRNADSDSTTNPRTTRTRSRISSPSSTNTNTDPPPSLLIDTIPPNLTLLLVGVNPGLLTGLTGFSYAHPSNLFWKLLHWSGITPIRHRPSDTYRLPELYNIGNTNIVSRPTRDASMLSRAEMDAGVPVLEAKVARQRPEAVCLVGKSIWEAVWRVRRGRGIRKEEFRYGWQDEGENMGKEAGGGWAGARVFVATTTSGLAAGMSVAEKREVWALLGEWVRGRRAVSKV
ncbi:DNA glycosylase [Aspergillus heteromorphus CBS 117.55]|uniref:DNA glycosylase n=1 Tax=Aspergillus heteromorphus CBS 117.55 TaxID=1448321 RepID=A0A317WNG3_9EURO|nr:DNA glycosylase [Aspergillus heteromorphus CBS 117.55]PWY86802.1 DNA glycosylase [Aspergillus heteromorphus CBS 117.55]